MESGQFILALIAALGLGSIVPKLADGVAKHIGGKFEAERALNG